MCSWIPIVHILFSFFIRFHKIDFYLGHKEEGAGKREREEQKVVSFSGKVNGHHLFWLLGGKIYILNKDFFRLSHAKRHDNSLSFTLTVISDRIKVYGMN